MISVIIYHNKYKYVKSNCTVYKFYVNKGTYVYMTKYAKTEYTKTSSGNVRVWTNQVQHYSYFTNYYGHFNLSLYIIIHNYMYTNNFDSHTNPQSDRFLEVLG